MPHLVDVLDWIAIRVDVAVDRLTGRNSYQDLPWAGIGAGLRSKALTSRWERMVPLLERYDVHTAVDVGCGSGWYPLKLAERGIRSIGVEKRPTLIRRALYARKKADLASAGFLVMLVEPDSVALLPAGDAVLLLAVWHHWVRDFGFERATAMLGSVWERTHKVLFFETGEKEIPDSWGLPEMTPDPLTWLSGWLAETCPGGDVLHLGHHEVGPCPGGVRADDGPDEPPVTRSLFAVVRAT